MRKDFVLEIYKKPQTVFTLKELSLFFPEIPYKNLKSKVSYFVKAGKLKRLRKGVYAKENFDFLELANKVYTPSYISFETVLQGAGIVFQEYRTVFVASYLTRKIKIVGQEIFYRKIKDEILLNRLGIGQKDSYFIASKERAFLDAVFLYKDYHFDNLRPLNWQKTREIAKIYSSKALVRRVGEYYQIYQKNNV